MDKFVQNSPRDRDDYFWITIDQYKRPQWEEISFLDETSNGYFTWPKRMQITDNENIISKQFVKRDFLKEFVELMISNDDLNENGKRIGFSSDKV